MNKVIHMAYVSTKQVSDLLERQRQEGWRFVACSGEFVFIFEEFDIGDLPFKYLDLSFELMCFFAGRMKDGDMRISFFLRQTEHDMEDYFLDKHEFGKFMPEIKEKLKAKGLWFREM